MSQPVDLNDNAWMSSVDGKREYNKALFAVVAAKYDFVTKALSLGRDQAWKRKLIAALPELPTPRCLDLASGTGDVAFALADRYPQGLIIGLDLSEEMLDVARVRQNQDNVAFQLGDMAETGIQSGSIDIVTGSYALRNAACLDAALDEIARVLRPGGYAAFLDFSKPKNRFIQVIQNGVLTLWGSFWGLMLHQKPSTYAYIAKSLRQFPDRGTLHEMIRERGFTDLKSSRFYFGTLELVVFQAPPAP
ncbi:ubiquinone/menaquinone biosynthesis methyltransferase [Stieleria varia]|uniref:Demethylmenaquinone methyltransferase n=1 Tax=Stieleria varia TaxID=2528005 RepID=A0A5C6A666_9BACT|nr:ubiquinone/menaquinone biosynthesis methyltransferase [Stieleria varia]TWT94561.1 Demethylmenaquinone methyltransferase [Stieleria varia]